MLKRMNYVKNTEKKRGGRLHGEISGKALKPNGTFQKTHEMKCRIRALEIEVEKLRSNVKFYQEIYLQDD